jgi:hypothetical protein
VATDSKQDAGFLGLRSRDFFSRLLGHSPLFLQPLWLVFLPLLCVEVLGLGSSDFGPISRLSFEDGVCAFGYSGVGAGGKGNVYYYFQLAEISSARCTHN